MDQTPVDKKLTVSNSNSQESKAEATAAELGNRLTTEGR